MREKYLIRDARGSRTVIGAYFAPPARRKEGVVVVGGPKRFAEFGQAVARSFGLPRTRRRVGWKFRLVVQGVDWPGWDRGLAAVRRRGASLEQVSRFRRLMG